jgi:hypothetical protein
MKAAKTNTKIDLYKLHKADYVASKKPVLVNIAPANYLSIEGRGEPGGEEFTTCIGALYGVAFTVKMTRKFDGRQDYGVCKLEGQWWSDRPGNFAKQPKSKWQWKLLIRTPDFVAQEELEQAIEKLLKRGKDEAVKRVRLETISEEDCVQMLHIGPYEAEAGTIDLMRELAGKHQLEFHSRHHEIYLSDPRRVAPEKLKTILRQPVRRA